MLVNLELEAFRKTQLSEYALRFLIGGGVTVATGLIAMKWGPVVGGLFLAFPAIFPASATLVEKHEGKNINRTQPHNTTHGRRAAGLDAAGSSIGSIGLLIFALVVWRMIPLFSTALVLIIGSLAWLLVVVVVWYLRRRIPTLLASHLSKRRARTG